MILGSHVKFNKEQLYGSVKEAISYGANTFMFYTGAPQNTIRSILNEELTHQAWDLMKENNIDINNVICHAPYIINLANDIKEGIIKNDFTNKRSDYNFIEAKKEQIELVIKELCKIGLDKGYNYHQLQVLVPMYRGVNGIDNLNNKLQEIFNPKSDNKDEFEFNDVIFREGDKVLQTKNLNDLEISNGDIGVIDSITKTNNNVKAIINFDGIIVEFNKKNFEDLKLGYAISIHKAQGSEFDVVIMPMDTSFKRMLYRKLIYTGITRAKKSLTLVGEKEAFIYGTSKLMEERNTLLKEMLINSITF